MTITSSRMPVFLLLGLCLVSVGILDSTAQAQIARMELHVIQSQSPTDQEFLTGRKDAKPVTITGELRIPRPGTDRLPAVVLLHGSSGASGLHDNWAREFNALGIATLIVDSFTGRGIVNTQGDQDQLSRLVGVLDAYRALELLAKHPRIDSERVVVMGFSRGGGAAHWAAIKRFLAMHGPRGGLTFAGHIALYPTCNRIFVESLDVVDKPIPYGQKTRNRLDGSVYDPAMTHASACLLSTPSYILDAHGGRNKRRGTDAWIGRPCWHTLRGRSIRNCCSATSTW